MRAAAWLLALALLAVLPASSGCGRQDRKTDAEQGAEIAALEKERDALRARIDQLAVNDPWAKEMPEGTVRIGVPTSLAADLIQRVASGFADQVTLELKNIRVRKSGRIKKVITIGDWNLRVTVNRVTAKLKTSSPESKFGGNTVALALPAGIVSGTGTATVNFTWDGRNVAGMMCGDQNITQVVTGGVYPGRYAVAGSIAIAATSEQILAEPVFPRIRVTLRVKISDASLAAIRKILDDRRGVCGFVIDRADIMGSIQRMIDKGFAIRLPTERIKSIPLPVAIRPSMKVRGETVEMGIAVSGLAITEHMIWLGTSVQVAIDG